MHIPNLFEMEFFNESSLEIDSVVYTIEKRIKNKVDKQKYELFCRNKYKKPLYDIYALFNPFNEATKAFYPFISFLKSHLKKTDVILDLSNRTGWSTSLLAGLFPDQTIISLWEGDTDVLGYNGFSYWFAEPNSNIKVKFTSLREKLPFEDKSIKLVFGFDLLHRQLKSNLLDELMRIAAEDALVLFPHVHLANAEPDPFFQRGGDLVHGKDYDLFFKSLGSLNKKAFVFSEPDLYRLSHNSKAKIKANPDTPDYNGLIAITHNNLDLENELTSFNYFDFFNLNDGYLVQNPLFEITPFGLIKLRTSSLEADIKTLLSHHPVYWEKIKNTIGYKLSEMELITLYWTNKNRSCLYIQKQLKIDNEAFKSLILKLQNLDILQILPIKEKHIRLNHYLAHQEFIESELNFNLQTLWNRAVINYPANIYAYDKADNTFYTFEEFNEIIKCVSSTLYQKNLKKGDKIILHGDIHFESMALFWACMNLGIVFIPIESSLPSSTFNDLLEQYNPELIFLFKEASLSEKWVHKTINFDLEAQDHSKNKTLFSEWLLESIDDIAYPQINEDDLGVILHTSGSTGTPKGVVLKQGQLFQSAKNVVKTYLIDEKDKYLAIGNLDSMSGLRNSLLVTAESGSSCIIPSLEEKSNIAAFLNCIHETETSLLVASPSFLNQLLSRNDLKNRLSKVRLVLTTGSSLSSKLKELFFEKTGKNIINYYGLTETTGFCIAESINDNAFNGNYLGIPRDCIAQVVDEDKKEVKMGDTGELRLYGYCISGGYANIEKPIKNQHDQWFYSGDLVTMNSEGGIEFIGRKAEFIKNSNSEIVYFSEIEKNIREIVFINDYLLLPFFENEAEKIALFISVNNMVPVGENIIEIIKNELQNKLGKNKIPSLIKILDIIPRTISGKPIKKELENYL